MAFYELTKTGGWWDYKQQGLQYDAFGNFNYGATAAALGLPYYVVQNAAGLYQGDPSTGRGIPLLLWPYGDDPAGANQILAGYAYAINGCFW
ncbi:MAG: polymorphic toxin type 44 domain-containing protein [Steroidobacteraceae bacterium]